MSSNDELNTILASKTDAVSFVKVSSANEREDNISNPGNSLKHGTLSSYVETFLNNLQLSINKNMPYESEGNLKVSEVLGGLARLYERIRTTIEYKGEHVLRRNAIERILKRLIWEKEGLRPNLNPKKIAESVVRELIWAKYLKNDSVPLFLLEEVEKAVEKYFLLFENLDKYPPNLSKNHIKLWIWGVASSEIEDILDPTNKEIFIRLMQRWFLENYEWKDSSFTQHEKEIQIYLSIHRSLMKSDEAIMRYYLLKNEVPNWTQATREDISSLISNFPGVYTETEKHLDFKYKNVL